MPSTVKINAKSDVETILAEMDELLDSLLKNAQKLVDVTQGVFEEDELESLQKKQQVLLDKLVVRDEALDKALQTVDANQRQLLQSRVHKKIEQFQQLNGHFIDNIANTHGLIHFEKDRLKKNKK